MPINFHVLYAIHFLARYTSEDDLFQKSKQTMSVSFLKVVYDEGDEYEGEWSADGKRNGLGSLKLASGVRYTGQFESGFFHGSGVLSFPDGSKYEGHFELGKFHGYGVYVNQHGMKFEVWRVLSVAKA